MMIKPGISTLSKCVDSRYTLVAMASKRARMIGESGKGLVPCDSEKAVSIAIHEIAEGKVSYIRNEAAIRREDDWDERKAELAEETFDLSIDDATLPPVDRNPEIAVDTDGDDMPDSNEGSASPFA
jgi:DNA-directed RNA polymerase subunit omega